MANKLSKNLVKGAEVSSMSSLSIILTWIINKYIVDVPPEVSLAMVIIATGAIAGVYNMLTHTQLKWPWTKKAV